VIRASARIGNSGLQSYQRLVLGLPGRPATCQVRSFPSASPRITSCPSPRTTRCHSHPSLSPHTQAARRQAGRPAALAGNRWDLSPKPANRVALPRRGSCAGASSAQFPPYSRRTGRSARSARRPASRLSRRRFGVMRGLRRADHGLFVTVCRRHLPAPDRQMHHRSGRRTGHPCPAARAAHGGRAGGRAIPRPELFRRTLA
jgi:hypothetical protein